MSETGPLQPAAADGTELARLALTAVGIEVEGPELAVLAHARQAMVDRVAALYLPEVDTVAPDGAAPVAAAVPGDD